MDNCNLRDRIPLNFGIAFFAPITSVAGSATIQVTQPLFTGNICFAPLLIALAEVFLFIADQVFHLESVPVIDARLNRRIQMPLGELRSLLNLAGASTASELSSSLNNQRLTNQTVGDRGFLTAETPAAPMLIGLSVFSDYSQQADSPTTQFIVPILEIRGLRGALPMIILALLITIFVRAVVPPQTTGSKPFDSNGRSDASSRNTFTMSPEALTQLLERFGKYFPSN